MRAVVLTGHGGLDKLELREDWPKPSPSADQVLVRIAACGLNNTDVNTRVGWYSKSVSGPTDASAIEDADSSDATWGGNAIPFPRVQGADVCGVVESAGHSADASLVGKRVLVDPWLRDWNDPLNLSKTGYFGSECNGGFAEYTVVDARQAHPVESELGDAELATFATSYVTAENMLNRASVGEGDTVLVTGASGGVGSALIQLTARRGATTIAMCSGEKADAVRAVGAKAVLSRSPEDLQGALRSAIGEDTVNVVADVVGGESWPRLLDAIARGGRYVCSGAIAGPIVELDLRTLYLHDLSLHGATVISPGTFADLVGYIERGEIRPLLAAAYPLEQLRDAQQAFIDKRHVGNIVVKMAQD